MHGAKAIRNTVIEDPYSASVGLVSDYSTATSVIRIPQTSPMRISQVND
jgi:hypothetical protein